ncbi:alpha/beta hydrolase family protein [Cupriavidus pauculus]|uniref:alpha/beta hydrolase family protein n=1 Tax=Cupriavidus pauculus TaxID=82633 RepID=UPI0007802E76|nr:alpha/beta hydrolase [Cupriavidus pauculus]
MTTNAKPITIKTEIGEVTGCLVSPTTKFAGLLFVHGWGASRTQFLHRATEVSSLGCICLTIELGARNTSRNLAEVVAAYDKLAEHPDIDPNAIGVVGSSYGGYIAALATELRAIRWLALRAPALPDVEEEQAQSLSSHQTDVSGKRRVIAADRSEALRACTGFKGDAFVVESQFDEIVPRIVVRSYIDAFIQASSITYRMLSRADHGLSAENDQQAYTKLLVRWLREMVTDARVSEGVTATRAAPVIPAHPKECDAASAADSDQNAREAQAAGADLNVQIKN